MNQSEFLRIWQDDSAFVECHTSGSTGIPKTIMLSKDFMRESAHRSIDFFGISSESRLHTCLDFEYIASKMMTVRCDVARCRLTSEVPSNRPLGSLGEDERVDLLSVVPSQLAWILESTERWRGVRNILVGGAPVSSSLRKKIAKSDYCVWESYGMTETSSHIALRRVCGDEEIPFITLPGITVSASDSGCLEVVMPGLEPLVTNDIAEIYSTTEFRILGRADNCVISGGIKIMPEEVERLLADFIPCDYCLSSLPDRKWGERLVLVAQTPDSDKDLDVLKKSVPEMLRQRCHEVDLGVKSPKEVVWLDHIPLTANGKIDRRALRNLLLHNSDL